MISRLVLVIVIFGSTAFADDPKAQVLKCFSDYLAKFSSNEKNHDLSEIKKRCLTKEFLARWHKIVQSTEADPLLLAQDYEPSWKTNVDIELLGSSAAKLVLGTNSEKYCLIVGLKKVSSGILISSSKRCSGENPSK